MRLIHRPAIVAASTSLALLTPASMLLVSAPAHAAAQGTRYTDADVAPVIQTDSPAQARMIKHNDPTKRTTQRRTRSMVSSVEQADAALALNNNTTLSSTNDITRTPPGGRAGTLRARGYSYVKVPLLETGATYTNNEAHTWWLGASPVNASSVKLSETWANSGISISLSFPLGAGFSGTGGSTTDTTSVSKNWQVHSYVDTVKFTAFDIYRVRHTVTGKFQFGTTAFTVTTTDSSLV